MRLYLIFGSVVLAGCWAGSASQCIAQQSHASAWQRTSPEETRGDPEEVRRWLVKNTFSQIWDHHNRTATLSRDDWVRAGKKIPAIEPLLRRFLESKDPSVDLPTAAYALAFVGTEKSVPVLVASLDSKDITFRMASAIALGQIRDKRAVKPLGKLLAQGEDMNVRLNVISALAAIGGQEAKDYLKSATTDEDSDIALAAKEALSRESRKAGETDTRKN